MPPRLTTLDLLYIYLQSSRYAPVKASLDAEICETKQIIPWVIEKEVYYRIGIKEIWIRTEIGSSITSWRLIARCLCEPLKPAQLWSLDMQEEVHAINLCLAVV